MNEVKQVLVMQADGSVRKCFLSISTEEPWEVSLEGIECGYLASKGDDLFNALANLRKNLEEMNYKLLCNGARKDVHPSGMSRSMSGGRKAYLMRKGEPARNSDMVDIFDYSEPWFIGTYDEQQIYYNEWIASLK